MDEEIKTGEMTGEIDESITVEEDFTLLEGKAVSISDDSDNKTNEEEVYEEALDIKESLDDIRQQIKDKLLNILEKGKITDADGCEIELLNDQYTEKYNELKDIANTVIPGGKGTNSESSTTNTTEVVKVNIDYDEILNAINERADWLYIDEDGQVMLNGEVVPKLKVVELEAEKIKADVGEFKDLTTENFTAVNAKIDNLKVTDLAAVNAEIENLKANKADINELNAVVGNIKILTSDIANINTLINGHLTSDNIQSLILTSDKVTVEDAFIKDAMIETVSASKINAGVINTNNVSIQSDDGSMLLQGNLQQFKDKNGKVRIQIGKDAKGDFTFVLYGEDGKGQLINQNGIQSSDAIADGLIVDAKVAEGANINAGKLDISSLFSEINGASETIKSTKIYLDNEAQTLDVAFKQMKTSVNNATGDINGLQEQMETNITKIEVAQGEIDTLIANTTITKADGTVIQLKDAYNSTKDTVDSHTTKIGSLETNYNKVTGDIASVTSKQSILEQNLNGFKTTVSNNYATTQSTSTLLKENITEYYLSTSNTTLSGGAWGTTPYTPTPGKYIWQRTKSVTNAGDIKYSNPICVSDEMYTVILKNEVLLLKCNSDGEVI